MRTAVGMAGGIGGGTIGSKLSSELQKSMDIDEKKDPWVKFLMDNAGSSIGGWIGSNAALATYDHF